MTDQEEKDFVKVRAELLQKLRAKIILNPNEDSRFHMTFSGSGDDGDLDSYGSDEEITGFFKMILEEFVTFDWYNDQGGGGDITWDIPADKITINGYYYVVTEETAMSEAEF